MGGFAEADMCYGLCCLFNPSNASIFMAFGCATIQACVGARYLSPTSNGRRLRSGAFLDPLVLWSWIVSCSTRTIGVLSNMMLLMGPRVLIGKDRRECEERMARPLCLLGSWRAPPPSRKRWNWMYPTQEHLRMEGASPNSQPLSSLSLTLFFSSIYSKIFIFFCIWTQILTCNAVSI